MPHDTCEVCMFDESPTVNENKRIERIARRKACEATWLEGRDAHNNAPVWAIRTWLVVEGDDPDLAD